MYVRKKEELAKEKNGSWKWTSEGEKEEGRRGKVGSRLLLLPWWWCLVGWLGMKKWAKHFQD
jgi:hypothetical protein